jgi:protein-tyrosine phosphatase
VDLPPPRPGRTSYSIVVVCLGNICRSPMTAVVLRSKLHAAGLADRTTVASSGVLDYHLGDPMDGRASATLVAGGYEPGEHASAQFVAESFAEHDLILAMDASNRRAIEELAAEAGDRDRVRMFREFDPLADGDLDVPDPWFGGQDGFDLVLTIVERTTDEIVAAVRRLITPG